MSLAFAPGTLELRHDGLADEETRVSHIEGWVSCLDRLSALIESETPTEPAR